MALGLLLFVAAALGLSGCLHSSFAAAGDANALPVVEWRGQRLSVSDSSTQEIRLRPSGAQPEIEVTLRLYPHLATAYRDWQTLAGERSPKGDWVRTRGEYCMVTGAARVCLKALGSQMLALSEWTQALKLSGWQVGQEPAFSRLFLQRNRMAGTGWVPEGDYLGLPWREPLYAMQYRWLGDTVQVMVAGPQDSTFYDAKAGFSSPSTPWRQGSRTGERWVSGLGGRPWQWQWGPQGVVLVQGCADSQTARSWAQDQYQALELFERDGFFTPKSAASN